MNIREGKWQNACSEDFISNFQCILCSRLGKRSPTNLSSSPLMKKLIHYQPASEAQRSDWTEDIGVAMELPSLLEKVSWENKMVIIYWTCGGVARVANIVTVRSQMDQTNHLSASRKFDFPGNLTSQKFDFPGYSTSREIWLPLKFDFPGNLTTQEIYLPEHLTSRKIRLSGKFDFPGNLTSREIWLPRKFDFPGIWPAQGL